jgi:hypothetical protein
MLNEPIPESTPSGEQSAPTPPAAAAQGQQQDTPAPDAPSAEGDQAAPPGVSYIHITQPEKEAIERVSPYTGTRVLTMFEYLYNDLYSV